MSSWCVYELRGQPDKYPGFLQVFSKDPPDQDTWKEDIGRQSLVRGPKPLGASYAPVRLQFDNEGKKKNSVGDFSFRLAPFIVLSERARQVLDAMLSAVGEFLEVNAPVPGFTGYRVLKHLDDCIDLTRSTYTKYENGDVLVRKPTMYMQAVKGHDIFAVPNAQAGVFVSKAFKTAVEKAKLKGFDFSREVPLV